MLVYSIIIQQCVCIVYVHVHGPVIDDYMY